MYFCKSSKASEVVTSIALAYAGSDKDRSGEKIEGLLPGMLVTSAGMRTAAVKQPYSSSKAGVQQQ